MTGQSPKRPALLPLPKEMLQDPISHPSCCSVTLCSATKPQGEAKFCLEAGLPCSTLSVSGRAAPGAGEPRNKLMLTPALYPPSLCLVAAFPGWSGDGLPCSHLTQLRGCLPSRLAPCRDERGRSPPYGAPGRLPAPGQVLLSGLHKTLLSWPRGLPSLGTGPCQPQHCRAHGSAWHILLWTPCRGCSPCSPCPLPSSPSAASPAGWVVSPARWSADGFMPST